MMATVEDVLAGRAAYALHCGDCLAWLPTLPAGCVDAVVPDPPFGIAYRNRRGDIRPHIDFAPEMAGDGSDVGQQVVTGCFRRGWPVCAFAHYRRPWAGNWRQWLVWDKGPAVGGGGDARTCWKYTWELIQVGGFGALGGERDSAVLRFWIGQNAMPDHPTQKPLPLLRYLLGKLTAPGSVVLDPFMGSGTTGAACLQTGRRFLGCELSPEYFAVARDRLAAANCEDGLFAPKPQPTLFDREAAP
jgi:hypothetical protein